MTTDLVSTITQVLNSDMATSVASKLGIDQTQVTRAFQGGVPGILAALVSLVAKPAGASALSATAAQQEPSMLSSLESALDGSGRKALFERGASTLNSLLGNTTMSTLTNAVGKYAGISMGDSKSVMGLLSPAVLGVLGQQQRAGGLDAAGLANLLASQKDSIVRALPAGFANYLSGTDVLDGLGEKIKRFEPAYVAPQQASSSMGWMLPVLGILAVGAIAWSLMHTPTKDVATLPPTTVDAPGKASGQTPGIIVSEVNEWIAKPAYSSDNKKVGEVVDIKRDADNKLTEAIIDTGSFLGIGATRFRITPDQIHEAKPDGLRLTLKEAEITNAVHEGDKSPQ